MSGYSTILDHRSMVFDTTRNKAYLKAIKQAVNPDSIVMDLGAGMGLFGLSAAKAGAKKVYLVEPEPIIDLAKQIAEANEFPNIESKQARIEQLYLPEKVDIIISVFTGNFLLSEDLLPSLFQARDTFLASQGKLIPDRAQMFVVPVSALDYHYKYIGKWSENTSQDEFKESEGIDLSLIRKFASNSIYYDYANNFNATFLSPPCKLLELDFMNASKADCHSHIQLAIENDSICHGWIGWFNMRLGEEWLSTSPEALKTHWRQAFLPIDPPVKLCAGDQVSFQLQRPEYGNWTWTMKAGNIYYRHSTFFSEQITQTKLLQKSNLYKPKISSQIKSISQHIITNFDGNTTLDNMAHQLLKNWPDNFTKKAETLRFIRKFIETLD